MFLFTLFKQVLSIDEFTMPQFSSDLTVVLPQGSCQRYGLGFSNAFLEQRRLSPWDLQAVKLWTDHQSPQPKSCSSGLRLAPLTGHVGGQQRSAHLALCAQGVTVLRHCPRHVTAAAVSAEDNLRYCKDGSKQSCWMSGGFACLQSLLLFP